MIKILLLLLPLVSVASANDEAIDINTGKVYEVNKGILDNEVELYDYETNKSKIHFSMGRLDYRTRHKSIVLKSEEKEAFRKKICRWEQQENFEKRSHVRDSDLENIRYAKDLVFGRKGRKK